MNHAPGSFSKNFAWHGTGLRKLHTVIRDGFHATLVPVGRHQFRDDSGLDASLSLIPINFFLHNRAGKLSVDELVFQAINRPHSIRFDRLGLFALHLNRAGQGERIVSRPAMWANEFVRERLWLGGVWDPGTLSDLSLDSFISDRMDALTDVRVKCRNNYRHLFELCEFWPSTLPVINSHAEHWISAALFLAWDRHILDGGLYDEKSLLGLVDTDQLHKLLGVTQAYAAHQAKYAVQLYLSVGNIERFFQDENSSSRLTPATPAPEISEEEDLEWLEQEESDEVVERRYVERQEQKRNRKKAAALKRHYDNTCMFCGTKIQVSDDRYYSEAAHIKGIGEPHNGPDRASNMLILCPNHHLQFDRGILRLQKAGNDYRIHSKTVGDPLHDKVITPTHSIDDDCVKYHHEWFGSKRP